MKGGDDGVAAGGQICFKCIFDSGQFCGGDDAGKWGVGLGRYMAINRVVFEWFLDVQVHETWRFCLCSGLFRVCGKNTVCCGGCVR